MIIVAAENCTSGCHIRYSLKKDYLLYLTALIVFYLCLPPDSTTKGIAQCNGYDFREFNNSDALASEDIWSAIEIQKN